MTKTISLFLVIFLIGFRLSYKNSGKFRESIRIALIWAIVTLSPLSVDEGQNPGFTPLTSFESEVMGITPLDFSPSDS